MRTVYVDYTVLDIVDVPDNWTDEQVEKLLRKNAPEGYNDMEWSYARD